MLAHSEWMWRSGPDDILPTGIREGYTKVIPNYPNSADAALQLVEWMSQPENGGWGFSSTRSQKDGSWEVFFEHASWDAHCSDADTLPLAISLAFLKANNIDPEAL